MERELLLLGLLRQEGRHGYELYDFIERTMQVCIDLKRPTAYYLLDKLAKGGYVEEREEQIGNRPTRRVYRLTTSGEAFYFELLRANLAGHTSPPFSDTIGLAFLDDLPAEESLPLLAERHSRIAEELSRMESVPVHPGSMQLVIEHQITYLAAELAWLAAVIDRLKAAHEGATHAS
jgi:DNA-binding PadR family transcriptional regulator